MSLSEALEEMHVGVRGHTVIGVVRRGPRGSAAKESPAFRVSRRAPGRAAAILCAAALACASAVEAAASLSATAPFVSTAIAAPAPPAAEPSADKHTEPTGITEGTRTEGAALPIPDGPSPACNVSAADLPDDAGGAITVGWTASPDDGALGAVTSYEILRFSPGETPVSRGEILAGETEYVDDAEDGVSYQYIVRVHSTRGFSDSEPSQPAAASPQWFVRSRANILIIAILFCAAVIYYIRRARSGQELYIRRIPGLEAVDDAVGRATEMGRPVLYVPGIETVSEVGTLAALTILGHVARRVAMHGTPLLVPCADPIVMATAQEIVRQSYAEVGQLDRFDASSVAYLTYDQFGYAAGVDGIMVRERPEAVFLLGYFAAESLILAETGHSIGAIQISGTKETSQLPFFVAACDYTLIGEELFAASSYLSKEPVMRGSLKGQDLAKLVIACVVCLGFVAGTLGAIMRPDGTSAPSRLYELLRLWLSTGG